MGGDKTEKTTIMVLKVDLQCSSCYKKVRKLLCKFPQIRDQAYDEKANKITITVVCCNPEKIRDKLCSKGCGVITSIDIKEPEKPKKVPKPNPVALPSKPPPPAPGYCCGQCYEGHIGGPCYQWYGRPVPSAPCYEWYGRPVPSAPCYEWYGRPVPCYDSYGLGPYGYGRGCYVSRCNSYLSEENATGCSIM